MKLHGYLLGLTLFTATAGSSLADPIVLKFEGIPDGNSIGNYYNGTGGGANNFGISFSSNAIAYCLNTLTAPCPNNPITSTVSRGGLGDPNSQTGGLYFIGASTVNGSFADDAAGFTGGFSLFYLHDSNAQGPASVNIYSGLDGTGTLLATLSLPNMPIDACSPTYAAYSCPLNPAGIAFSGTAESVQFINIEKDSAFDDVTFGSAIPDPSPVPEPSTFAMMLTGAGAAFTQVRRLLAASRT
jgi:hypothetical protein